MRYLTLATVVGASLLVFEAIKAFSPAVDSLPTQWAIPDFAPNRNTAWALDSLIDDLLDPPIANSSAWAELFAGDNCEPRSKNAL